MSARHRAHMRIPPDVYEKLRLLMRDSALKHAKTERERWDALNAVIDADANARTFVCGLYYFYNDSHIDTALRHIVAGSAI